MTVNAINLGARMFHICISLYIYVHSVCVDTTSLSREFPYTRLKSAFLMGFHSRGFLGETGEQTRTQHTPYFCSGYAGIMMWCRYNLFKKLSWRSCNLNQTCPLVSENRRISQHPRVNAFFAECTDNRFSLRAAILAWLKAAAVSVFRNHPNLGPENCA